MEKIRDYYSLYKKSQRKYTFYLLGLMFVVNCGNILYNFYLAYNNQAIWYFTMGIYYMILGIMRALLLHTERTIQNLSSEERIKKELHIMHIVGWGMFALIFAFSGTVTLTVYETQIKVYSIIPMITLATFGFYKITLAIINTIRVRKSKQSPLLITLRNISLASAAISILPMQTSMIYSFSEEAITLNVYLMTVLTGTIIALILFILSISMITKKGASVNG